MTPPQIIDAFERVGVRLGYADHPAWPEFIRRMAQRSNTDHQAVSAWLWFRDGWAACDSALDSEQL